MLRLRQLLPALIAYAGREEPINGRTRLQKMVFLLQEKVPEFSDKYAFRPYDYGPYASNLQMDLDEMIERGVLQEKEWRTPEEKSAFQYFLTTQGRAFVERVLADKTLAERHALRTVLAAAEEVKSEANRKPLASLLRDVYEEHPRYASRSKFQF